MDALRIDFHPRAARAAQAFGWAALALAGAAAVGVGSHLKRSSDQVDALQERHAVLEARTRSPVRHVDAVGPELARRITAANHAIDALAVPWAELFRSVESADARGLGVMSLVPNARTHLLRLSGEARAVPELLAYVDRLAALPVLEQVRLEGYETVQRDGVDVVSFTVAATWRTD